MKFETQELVTVLGEVGDRDTLVLQVTAQLMNGEELDGWDCVVVIDNEDRKDRSIPRGQIQLDRESSGIMSAFRLHQNRPNPFRWKTTIVFSLAEGGHAKVVIQDLAGRRVATLADTELSAGVHTLVWNAKAPAGMYLCCLDAGGFTKVRRMLLLR
jgi:hypothetical protein